MTNIPPDTILQPAYAPIDAVTLTDLSKQEWARRQAIQFQQENGEWPSVRQLARIAECGHGTAQRALKQAQGIA